METKVCTKCGETKNVDDFYKRGPQRGESRSAHCSQCHYIKYRARITKNVDALYGYLLDKSCATCGETDSVLLDFHHDDPSNKVDCISNIRRNQWNTILMEIEKCSILCSNCHRKIHSVLGCSLGRVRSTRDATGTLKECSVCATKMDSSLFYSRSNICNICTAKSKKEKHIKNISKLNEYKSSIGCLRCGEKDPVVLDFHHRDPSSKLNKIANIVDCSWTVVKAEIDKCELICSNCHRKEHATNWYIPNKEVIN